MATLVIDTHEGRDVAICDVPGAYLSVSMPKDKFILIEFVNEFVNLMCMANPSLKPMVRADNGKKVIYLMVRNALYGCVESGLLWYQMFIDKLKADGFDVNKDVVTKVINGMERTFGKLTVNRGKKHTLLGMSILINDDKTVSIDTSSYIKEILEAFP